MVPTTSECKRVNRYTHLCLGRWFLLFICGIWLCLPNSVDFWEQIYYIHVHVLYICISIYICKFLLVEVIISCSTIQLISRPNPNSFHFFALQVDTLSALHTQIYDKYIYIYIYMDRSSLCVHFFSSFVCFIIVGTKVNILFMPKLRIFHFSKFKNRYSLMASLKFCINVFIFYILLI